MKLFKSAFTVLIYVIFLAIIVEITLRIQQYIGPIEDLEMQNVSMEWQSDVLNHKHAHKEEYVLSLRDVYGKYAGFAYTAFYDSNGLRIYREWPPTENCTR